MKRKICMILCACFFMTCMVVPASAAENDNYINVLDYCTADNSGSNYVSGDNSSTSDTFTYSCPVGPFRYVDMIIQTVNGPLSSISLNGYALTVLHLQSNLYRVFGTASLSSTLVFTAVSTAANTRYNITQFRASLFWNFSSADTGFLSLATYSSSSPYQYMPDADTSAVIRFNDYDPSFGTYQDPVTFNYKVYAYPQNWKKYDTVDMYFSVRADSVTSLAVSFNDNSLPFTYSYFDVSNDSWYQQYVYGYSDPLYFKWDLGQTDSIYFHVTIDLSDVDRTYSSYPQVVFTGQYNVVDTNQHVTLLSVVGTVETDSRSSAAYWFQQLNLRLLNQTNSLKVWFQDLENHLTALFSDLYTALDNSAFFSAIADKLDILAQWGSAIDTRLSNQTNSLKIWFQELRTDLDTLLTQVDTTVATWGDALNTRLLNLTSSLNVWFQELRTDLDTLLTQVDTTVATWGDALNTRLLNLTSSLKVWFQELRTDLDTLLTKVDTTISTWGSELNTRLINQTKTMEVWFQKIENAIRGDTAPGDAFQDEVDEKDQQLDDMAAVMDSVNKPALDSINVDVSGYVSPTDVSALAAPLLVFITGDVFGPIIIMSILLATVSYVLYGKRG